MRTQYGRGWLVDIRAASRPEPEVGRIGKVKPRAPPRHPWSIALVMYVRNRGTKFTLALSGELGVQM